jgi:FMN reductase
MSHKLKLVAVSGGLQRPSRTHALVDSLIAGLAAELELAPQVIYLSEIAPKFAGALLRSQLPVEVEAALTAIESADALIVASPIYRGTYTGLFKHLFDFVHQDALVDVPVLLAASGGSDRHALAIDHQLRPLFSFFQATTLPIGVYATDRDFHNYQVSSAELRERIVLAVTRAVPVLSGLAERSSARQQLVAA